jgi:preprotein translocase subunit SecE
MTEADSSSPIPTIPVADRQLMRRLTVVLLFLFGFVGAFWGLDRFYSKKFFADTGGARWIWMPHSLSQNVALAFFATREVDLPEQRVFTKLKVAVDPEYTLWFNGIEIGGRFVGEERKIDVYDVSQLARTGKNRIVIVVRARQGVGGLLASLDIGPEQQNVVVSDGDWKIYTRWTSELPRIDPPEQHPRAPMVFGAPPYGRWNYLDSGPGKTTEPVSKVIQPREVFELRAMLPAIRTREGIAVAVAEPTRARAHDFGFTHGRLRLTLEREPNVGQVIDVRFANAREELGRVEWAVRSYVVAPGERVITDPEPRNFRYVMVFGRNARAEVLQ